MSSEKLKLNKIFYTGLILAIIAIATLIALSMTFAKYAVSGTGEDSARVAKWGLDLAIQNDLNLFDNKYTNIDGSTTVKSINESNVVAPGTYKTIDITLANFDNYKAPEVMYHFEPSLTITNNGQGEKLVSKLDNLPGWHWRLGRNNEGTTEYKTSEELINAVKAYQQKDIAPNVMPQTKTMQLGWVWYFDDSGGNAWDASDTELGNLLTSGQLSEMKVTLSLNAYQCQGGCATTYKPIATEVAGLDVVFLPAFSNGNAPGKFYKLDTDTNSYIELDNSTMAKLASEINNVGAENVYTDTKNATFYGTIDREWNNTFDASTTYGDAKGLNTEFKAFLDTAGVKTVYGDYVNGVWTKETTGNWDAQDTSSSNKEPKLGTVGYNSFYKAYSKLLDTYSTIYSAYPWSSRADFKIAYRWDCSESIWGNYERTYKRGVVLSKSF